MALEGALQHWKTEKLARLLGQRPYVALGLMEAMWAIARRQAPTGAIGRLSNEDLLYQLRHEPHETHVIDAMVDAGFIDRHPQHRLVVHNWSKRVDDSTDAKLYRLGLRYWDGQVPRGKKLGKKEKERYYGEHWEPAKQLFPQGGTEGVTDLGASVPAPGVREREDSPVHEQQDHKTDSGTVQGGNLVVFPSAPFSAVQRLPEPEPEPEPVPVPDPVPEAPPKRTLLTLTGTCREIVCAYPASVAVGMSPLEVPKDQVAQVEAAVLHEAKKSDCDPALAAEYLLGQTRAFAEAVAQWPPGEQRFVPKLRNWLAEYQYRRSEEEWRRGTNRQRDGTHDGGVTRSAAAERWSAGDDAFRSVYADLVPARTG